MICPIRVPVVARSRARTTGYHACYPGGHNWPKPASAETPGGHSYLRAASAATIGRNQ